MGLTWDEFLKLATIIDNLVEPIYDFDNENIETKEKNRKISEAAKEYLEFFNDSKYLQFMSQLRISLTKI